MIANGGIFDAKDASTLTERTGADGVMIARGALENPFLFSFITGAEPFLKDRKTLILYHIDLLKKYYDDKTAAVRFRKQLCLYLKGIKNAVSLKQKLADFNSTDTIKDAVIRFFDGEKNTQ